MEVRDFKYFMAYTIPAVTSLAIWFEGFWSWLTVLVAFVLIPIIEILLKGTNENLSDHQKSIKEKSKFFDLLLYINLFLVYGIGFYYLYKITHVELEWVEIIGLTLSTGILLGANGINVAHELGHKTGKIQQISAILLLLPSLYMHFIIEHNRGHHLRVGTPEDPATSRYGENVFQFWLRSVVNGYLSAWSIANRDIEKLDKNKFSLSNLMIQFTIIQILYLVMVGLIFGMVGLVAALSIAIVSFLLLETINYIEHYGLERKLLANGKYERVENFHSWNSNHEVGRMLLYELTRHSDHHYKAFKKYQVLDDYPDSPQLPFGYPTSILLALFPPLWFKIMNHRVKKWREEHGFI